MSWVRAIAADQLGFYYFAEHSAQLALHLNRETMHHGGEIGVLRDLYRAGARHA